MQMVEVVHISQFDGHEMQDPDERDSPVVHEVQTLAEVQFWHGARHVAARVTPLS